MIRQRPLPSDIHDRLHTLGKALERCEGIVFAYLFGGAGKERLDPLSDVDVAVYLDAGVEPGEAGLEVVGAATRHLGTDEVDVVILNTAPIALVGRILQSRRVILERDPQRRHRFESLALRHFLDFRVLERRLLAWRYPRG